MNSPIKQLWIFWPFLAHSFTAQANDLTEFKNLSLEQLSETSIELASKKEQNLTEVASAAYVITQEDIRRSGATSLPELFRGIPGFSVAQVDSNKWGVSSRGFNNLFANKMLVMIDGRSIYDPLFSGVYWNDHDLIFEDIKKIEVIRGPGATIWGSNAVNGVINIVTQSAKDTHGLLSQIGTGSHEKLMGAIRYGSQIGTDFHYRLYSKYMNKGDFVDFSGNDAFDEWDMARGGFRADWQATPKDQLSFKGEVFGGEQGGSLSVSSLGQAPVSDNLTSKGGFIQTGWVHQVDPQQEFKFDLYYSHLYKDAIILSQKRDILNLDFQHQLNISSGFDVIWGLGYRFAADELQRKLNLSFDPEERDTHLLSTFVQTDLSFLDGLLNITLGSKLEHNDYSGFEVQPSIRGLINLSDEHKIWAAVSRAVRTPSRADHDLNLNINTSPNTILNIQGNDHFDAEDLLAYEIGYRFIPANNFSLDISGFYNDYSHLATNEPQTPYFSNGQLIIPVLIDNKAEGETYGVELSSQWQVFESWRLQGTYSWLEMMLRGVGSADNSADLQERRSPHHQFSLHSYLNLPYNTEFDSHWYYVDNVPGDLAPSYHRLDLRLGWHPLKSVELSFIARNLLDPQHPESSSRQDGGVNSSQVERSFYAQANFRF